MVSAGIGNHQKSWRLEGCLDLVSEVSRSETARNRSSSGGSDKLQHSSPVSLLEDVTLTLAGFSGATMAQAAGRSFSPVLFRLMM